MRLTALLCLLLALPVQAADFQSVASIRAAALSTLDPATEAEASVDAGLRLPACPAPLQARATGNRTVEVACPQAGGWKLFVPVTVRPSGAVSRRLTATWLSPRATPTRAGSNFSTANRAAPAA